MHFDAVSVSDPWAKGRSTEVARHARMQAERKVDPVKKAQKEQEVTGG